MKLNLNFDLYKGVTLLKNWWGAVKSNFEAVQTAANKTDDELSDEIANRQDADAEHAKKRAGEKELGHVAVTDMIFEPDDSLEYGDVMVPNVKAVYDAISEIDFGDVDGAEVLNHAKKQATETELGHVKTVPQIPLTEGETFEDGKVPTAAAVYTALQSVMQQTQTEITDLKEDIFGETETTTYECVLPSEIPSLEPSDSYSDELYVTIPSLQIKVNGKTVLTRADLTTYTTELSDCYLRLEYDFVNNRLYSYIGPYVPLGISVDNEHRIVFPLYEYSQTEFDFKRQDGEDVYKVERQFSEYASSNHDTSGSTYTVYFEQVYEKSLADLGTVTKSDIVAAINELVSKDTVHDVAITDIKNSIGTLSDMLDTLNGADTASFDEDDPVIYS